MAPNLVAQNEEPRETTWCTDGSVMAIARQGNAIYIGGGFTNVLPHTGYGVPVRFSTGEPPDSFAKVGGADGSVSACVSDGSGGWYIGGHFDEVGKTPMRGLAHILADGSLDVSWDVQTTGSVVALALTSSTLYVGGGFSSIGGAVRMNIAAIDRATGLVTSWNPGANHVIYALAVSGQTIYAGGIFSSIGGKVRSCIAALDASSGLATPWDPEADNSMSSWPSISALAISGSTIYAAGNFTSIGGKARSELAALDGASGLATDWDPAPNSTVNALAVSGSRIYAGGAFNKIGGQTRRYIAALDGATGQAMPWNPSGWYPSGGDAVQAIALSDPGPFPGQHTVFIGCQRGTLAAFESSTGNSISWRVGKANDIVFAMAASDASLYLGGRFTHAAGKARSGLAAIDAATGKPTSWNPNVSGRIDALALTSATIYIGGNFSSVGGKPRKSIAALDTASGSATSWNPSASFFGFDDITRVNALVVSGSMVYAGGMFSEIGGQPRTSIAALDASTGFATSWNPNETYTGSPYATINALALSGSTIYAAGSFAQIGGQPRLTLAALDIMSGRAISWNPNPIYTSTTIIQANSLVVWGSTLYAGGYFSNIGGQPRKGLAALDATTGMATDWTPTANYAGAIALSPSTVYVGGFTPQTSGLARSGISALDRSTGQRTPWNPAAILTSHGSSSSGYINCLLLSGQTLYVGGNFTSIGGLPQSNFAQFDGIHPPPTVAFNWSYYE